MVNRTEKRILYVEGARGRGGSVKSLFELANNIDKTRFDPIVLFHHPNKFRDLFMERGIRTLVINRPGKQESLDTRSTDEGLRDNDGRFNLRSARLVQSYRSLGHIFRLGKYDVPLAMYISRLIRNERIDLVHNNNTPYGNRTSILGARLANVPQISHVRRLCDYSRTEHIMTRIPDKLIFISRATEGSYQKYGINHSRSTVITNPIDVSLFDKSYSTAGLREELKLTEIDFVISNIGRLDSWKGHEIFIQALAPIIRDNPGVKSLIVGEAGSERRNIRYQERLYQFVRDLKLQENIAFTGHRDDIPQIMALSDIIVHSASEPEPFGRVIVEAMAAGRPIIATAAGGPLEIIEDGVTGLLVPPGDVPAMSQAMLWVIENPQKAEQMAKLARQNSKAHYSIEKHVHAVQGLYNVLLNMH